jgi:hypothetical protein
MIEALGMSGSLRRKACCAKIVGPRTNLKCRPPVTVRSVAYRRAALRF